MQDVGTILTICFTIKQLRSDGVVVFFFKKKETCWIFALQTLFPVVTAKSNIL